jgi:hypothetical protein
MDTKHMDTKIDTKFMDAQKMMDAKTITTQKRTLRRMRETLPGILCVTLLMFALLLTIGCKKNQTQNGQPSTQETAAAQQDPADLNEASTTTAAAPANQVADQSATAPTTSSSESYDESSYPETATGPVDDSNYEDYDATNQYATDAPPPLPDYEQPDDPGDGYIWTPGYWAWGTGGYYWVPGAWTQPPYSGALWTPGYWGYNSGRYGWHHGYWGVHIGFYGGVNYGFGYIGQGYFGGYWQGGHFWYNQAYNRVNAGGGINVYNNRTMIRYENNSRVSYVGGNGGLNVHPTPNEFAAMREQHAAPMRTQIANEHAAVANRGQAFAQNHGKPQMVVAPRAIAADRGIAAPAAARAQFNRPTPQAYHPAPARALTTRPTNQVQPGQNGRPVNGSEQVNRPGAPGQENRPGQPVQQHNNVEPQRNTVQPEQHNNVQPQQHNNVAPQQHNNVQPQRSPEPQQRNVQPQQRNEPQVQHNEPQVQHNQPQQHNNVAPQQHSSPQPQQHNNAPKPSGAHPAPAAHPEGHPEERK